MDDHIFRIYSRFAFWLMFSGALWLRLINVSEILQALEFMCFLMSFN
jgi:hypothetical protein